MLNLRALKARPHDLDAMLAHSPGLIELHCSVEDLRWQPQRRYDDIELAVHLPEYDGGQIVDPAHPRESRRESAVFLFCQAMGRAIAWRSFFPAARPKIVFHPGGADVERLPADVVALRRQQLARSIDEMRAMAGDEVELLIENMPAHCWFFGGDWPTNIMTGSAELTAACERHDIGITLDLCHLYLACNSRPGSDLLSEVRAMLPHTRHVHYSDGRGETGEGIQIGDGDMPVGRLLNEVKQGTRGTVWAVPEVWFAHEDGGRGFVVAWERAERAMNAIEVGC